MAQVFGNNKKNTLNGTIGNDEIYGFGKSDILFGFAGDDLLNGGGGGDTLYGGDGNDTIIGGNGKDLMFGGSGADTFSGGDNTDTVSYEDATGAVVAYVAANISGQGATGDTYDSTIENLIGSSFDDFLQAGNGGTSFGGGGDDHLYGASYGGGTDAGTLRGDAGFDTLDMTYGDTRAWVQKGQGYDTISGFIEGSDTLFIKLSDFGLGNALDTNEIINSNTATAVGGNAQFIYEGDAGNLWFDENGSAAGGLTLIAKFTGSTISNGDLGTNDFEFIV